MAGRGDRNQDSGIGNQTLGNPGEEQDLEALTDVDRVFNDLIDDFTKSDFKSIWEDFEIFKITLTFGDLI
jgi:hypothetical protein